MICKSLYILFCFSNVFHEIHGTSTGDLEMKVDTLEARLEILEGIVFRLMSENDGLKGRVQHLEKMTKHCEDSENEKQMELSDGDYNQTSIEIDRYIVKSGKRERKVFMSNSDNVNKMQTHRTQTQDVVKKVEQRSPPNVIAFHAYLSTSSPGPLPAHHIIKFDMVSLNRGNGYNAFDGIFIAPVSGTYVFTWAFMSEAGGVVSTQLMKNSAVLGTRYADSNSSTVWDFATGTVVVDVNQGDHVYVELLGNSVRRVLSIPQSRTTFSGWLLN